MKRSLTVFLLALLGCACGIAVGLMTSMPAPPCGECGTGGLGYLLGWMTALTVAFPVTAHLVFRSALATMRGFFLAALTLCAVSLLPAHVVCTLQLRAALATSEAAREVRPEIDFPWMAISEKAVPQLGIAEAERCAFGIFTCDRSPPHAEAICRQGTVNIPQEYWGSFKKLPAEDLPGLVRDETANNRSFKNACKKSLTP